MGQQVIKQPNGLYCIYNSISSGITYYDMTPEEIVEVWAEEARGEIVFNLKRILGKIEAGKPAYYQFTMSFEQALIEMERAYGEEARNVVIADMMLPEEAAEKLAKAEPLGYTPETAAILDEIDRNKENE